MPSTPGTSSAPRRRVGAVTTNACTECRKKRSKCDGGTPCSRCASQGVTCVYEVHARQTKDELRAEIEQLRNYKAQSEHVFSALAEGPAEKVLDHIKSTKSIAEVYHCIGGGGFENEAGFKTTFADPRAREKIQRTIEGAGYTMAQGTTPGGKDGDGARMSIELRFQPTDENAMDICPTSIADAASQRPLVNAFSRSPSEATVADNRVYGQQQLLGHAFAATESDFEEEDHIVPHTWTKLSDNVKWVTHLMALYFSWEYPTFASLSKDHFMEDFFRRNGPRGFCSPLLVNAMLALGCRFSNLPEAMVDPNDPSTKGDHFFAEAKRLLELADNLNDMATIQALGLMAIREGSCGRDTESFYYVQMAIRIAVEMGLHNEVFLADPAEREVRRATFWGAFTLDQAWSLNLSKLPHLSYSVNFPDTPSIITKSEMAPWLPYTDQGVTQHIAAYQPCNVHSVYKCYCELSRLIHSAVYTLYSPEKRLTSKDLIRHYSAYLAWYDEMPEVLKVGFNFTPSVLFVHIYYHYAVLGLFLPFINLRLKDSQHIPSIIISESASAITKLLDVYDAFYTLNHTPCLTPYLILLATIAHLKSQHSDLSTVQRSIHHLQRMSQCHGFATRALEIVKFLAAKWGLHDVCLDVVTDANMRDEFENVKSRGNSTNLFVPHGGLDEEDNVLFSAFPLQGLPLIGSREELEKDGFIVGEGGDHSKGQ